jgi:hypothetical protein
LGEGGGVGKRLAFPFIVIGGDDGTQDSPVPKLIINRLKERGALAVVFRWVKP